MSWLTGWSKRKKITLTGGSSGAQTDFQIKLTIVYDSDMESDFDDLRFTRGDGETLIDAWLETKINDTSATVWAEFPTTPVNTVEQIYYMYYGKVGAVSDWDGPATFPLFDHFDGASLDTNKWYKDTTGNVTQSGSKVTIWGENNSYINGITSKAFFDTSAYIMEMYITDIGNHYAHCGWADRGVGSNPSNSISFRNATSTRQYLIAKASVSTTANMAWATNHIQGARRSGTTAYFYQDRSELTNVNNATYVPTISLGVSLNSTKDISIQVDWALVRKYAANPPTYAFGNEESAPTGNPFWYYNLLKRRN